MVLEPTTFDGTFFLRAGPASAWVNHLSLDVERFWFRAVIPGAKSQSGMLSPAWKVSDGEPVEDVLHRYRDNIEHADAIIATRSTASARSRSTS